MSMVSAFLYNMLCDCVIVITFNISICTFCILENCHRTAVVSHRYLSLLFAVFSRILVYFWYWFALWHADCYIVEKCEVLCDKMEYPVIIISVYFYDNVLCSVQRIGSELCCDSQRGRMHSLCS